MINKKVLMIAFIYPPLGGSGVQRTLKFSKFLPQYNWQTWVVCGDDSKFIGNGIDTSLLSEIPHETQIWRKRFINPYGIRNRFYRLLKYEPVITDSSKISPLEEIQQNEKRKIRNLRALAKCLNPIEKPPIDPAIYWAISILPGCLRLIQKEKINLIYSSSFPYSDHLVGLWLKKLTGLPWVADFRDPWTQIHFYDNRGWRKIIDFKTEHDVLIKADRVISTSPIYNKNLASLLPKINEQKFLTIENGYDSQDFLPIRYDDKGKKKIGEFQISHVGVVYDGIALPFLKAISQIEFQNLVLCNFYGGLAKSETLWLAQNKINAQVRVVQRIPHSEAISVMRSSDILLLLINDNPKLIGHYPGKIFEYMASGTPILMVGPQGSAAKLIEESGTGVCVLPSDQDSLCNFLNLIINQPQTFKDRHFHPRMGYIQNFERSILTKKLATVFDELTTDLQFINNREKI